VPLGILWLGFSPKQSSGLSQASIFGASLGGLMLNLRQRHPTNNIRSDAGVLDNNNNNNKNRHLQVPHTAAQDQAYSLETTHHDHQHVFYTRPLIHYDMALFLAPMEMAGAVLGVLVQQILPNWLYLLIAGLVLSVTAYKTYQKFGAVRNKERQQEEQKQVDDNDVVLSEHSTAAEAAVCASGTSVGADDDNNEIEVQVEAAAPKQEAPEQPEPVVTDNATSNNERQLRQEYLRDDMRQYPREKIAALIVLWLGLLVLTLFKGGKGVDSVVGITCQDTAAYSSLIVAQFVWMFWLCGEIRESPRQGATIARRRAVPVPAQRSRVGFPVAALLRHLYLCRGDCGGIDWRRWGHGA